MTTQETKTNEGRNSKAAANQRFGKNCISFIPPHSKFTVQPKLAINQPNDVYEQEADRIAEQVMSTPELATSSVKTEGTPGVIIPVQRTDTSNEGIQFADGDLETQLSTSKGTGNPLPDEAKLFMEQRFGADYSQVQIHADSEADDMNRQVSAHAFTHKQHIYFRAGKYNPESTEGKRLLAHELTHVVQQSLGPVEGTPIGGSSVAVSDPSDCFEQEADSVTERVMTESYGSESALGALESNVGDTGTIQREGEDEDSLKSAILDGLEGSQEDQETIEKTQAWSTLAGTGVELAGAFLEGNPYFEGVDAGVARMGDLINFMDAQVSGQDLGESVGSTVGQWAGDELLGKYVTTPEDMLINTLHSVTTLAGAPEEATDVTEVMSDMTPSQLVQNLGGNAGRAFMNLISGDSEGLARQKTDLQEGDSGAVLQGYTLGYDVLKGVMGGEDLESTIMQVGSTGQDSPIARIGSQLGDVAFQFFNQDLPEVAEVSASDQRDIWQIAKDMWGE